MCYYESFKTGRAGFIGITVNYSVVSSSEKYLFRSNTKTYGTSYKIPENIQAILVKACYDCHSNNTVYPWYNNIQPVAWWLNDHVVSGKRHLNFDEFTAYSIARQYRKIQQCAEEVKNKNMPLLSYTWVHKNAILTQEEKLAFINWCSAVRDSIKAKYPADSLVMPKRK